MLGVICLFGLARDNFCVCVHVCVCVCVCVGPPWHHVPEQFVPGRPCLSRLAIKHSQHGPNLTRHCSKHATAARKVYVCMCVRVCVCLSLCAWPQGRPPFFLLLAFLLCSVPCRISANAHTHTHTHTNWGKTSKTIKWSSADASPPPRCLSSPSARVAVCVCIHVYVLFKSICVCVFEML